MLFLLLSVIYGEVLLPLLTLVVDDLVVRKWLWPEFVEGSSVVEMLNIP